MQYLKRMKIRGFKKFKKFDMNFNEKINIVVGDNESGKSTLLEAIDVVISQKYKNYDKYIIKELINRELISEYEANPNIESLPKINIDIEFELESLPKFAIYRGMNHHFEKNKMIFGISYKCEIPSEFIPELMPMIELGKIPYEYYQMSWNTFQGDTYNTLKKPLKFLLIDNANIDSTNSFNYYNKTLFANSHDDANQLKIKSDFRTKINKLFEELELNKVNEHQKFGVNERKIIFENIITILDDNIPLENKGKGKENIIKTKIALDKNVGNMDVVAIEEPENHLSFTNLRKMIKEIEKQTDNQLIITTHESMIASSLNLKNVTWIKENSNSTLSELDDEDCKFFLKSTNNNILQYILSNKVILVEGPTEALLIPRIFEMLFHNSLENFGITIIDCSGIKYKRYLDIAYKMKKRVAVLTDNDKKQKNIDFKNKFNLESENIKIFMDNSIENWTWEVCFYNLNNEKLDKLITIDENADYFVHGVNYGQVLGKMLNNKVDIAYLMYDNEFNYEIPEYIKEALEWIKE